MYCTLHPEGVQIALKKTDDNIRCTEYIAAADAILSRVTKDLLFVQSYISRGQDILYWIQIREILRERFIYIDKAKKNIQYSMDLFESNIFTAFQSYLQNTLQRYYQQLQREVDDWYPNDLPAYHKLVLEQIEVIESIRMTTDFDHLLPLATRYLYLRRELAWKLVW
jgi:hypothetical protein